MDDDLKDIDGQLGAISDWLSELEQRLTSRYACPGQKELQHARVFVEAARERVQAVQVAKKPS